MKKSILIAIFIVALGIQTFHMVEHFVQVEQHFIQGLSPQDSNGLIPKLNLEWVHWVYNFSYFALLLIILKKLPLIKKIDKTNGERLAVLLFGVTVVFQAYHVIEHSVRMIQFLQTDCTPCIGWLGMYVDPIALHFIINFQVFVFPILLFYKLITDSYLK